ncbi:hypothetical protein VNO80_11154 [Phaseolus coccineus]|uniref:Uncharacterized protein n=1 Tax=Phaseolus coccineus TaxID=3886 RepID=A0AAN9N9K4_PHACN
MLSCILLSVYIILPFEHVVYVIANDDDFNSDQDSYFSAVFLSTSQLSHINISLFRTMTDYVHADFD